jgi:hypothetical protein
MATRPRASTSAASSASVIGPPSTASTARVVTAACAGVSRCDPPPLWLIARRTSPRGRTASRSHTLSAPADSPNTVTLAGSPPNAEALSRTHSRAATWSRRPRFSGKPGTEPNPSTPSR